MALVSVIVPVYNVEQFLKRCVDSILAQTFKDFELILVDDGSPDNCGNICDEYAKSDNRIHVIHKDNGGLSDARNAGIEWVLKNSDSKYFSFIDSDDFVHTRFLEIFIKTFNETNSDIVVCEMTRDMEKEEFFNQDTYSVVEYDKHDFILSTYQGEWSRNIASCSKIYKRNLFEEIRFPFGKKYEDGMTIYKVLMNANKISGVSIVLYYWYYNSESISSQKTNATSLLDREEALRGHMSYYSLEYEDVNLAARSFYLNQMHMMLWDLDHNFVQNKNTRKIRRYFSRKARKYFRLYKDLCTEREKKSIYEYLYPMRCAIKNKLNIKY